MSVDVKQFEQKIGLTFQNTNLLKQAFMHRSYLNEHKDVGLEHNERLEFLGDAVLELIMTDHLYRKYPEKTEGELTSYRAALVNAVILSEVAQELSMNDYLLLSKGEAKDTGRARQVILANTFEAVLGAIYLDQGYDAALNFIEKNLFTKTDLVVTGNLWQDPKSYFQEKAQETFGITPVYQLIKEVGPDHNKKFTVGVCIGDDEIARGEGHSKREAEQEAAEKGLKAKGWS
jgi:ribonuclease III